MNQNIGINDISMRKTSGYWGIIPDMGLLALISLVALVKSSKEKATKTNIIKKKKTAPKVFKFTF